MLPSARAQTHTETPNVIGEEKAYVPAGTRTQDLSHIVLALWQLTDSTNRNTYGLLTVVPVASIMSELKEVFFVRSKIHPTRNIVMCWIIIVVGYNLVNQELLVYVFMHIHVVGKTYESYGLDEKHWS